MNYDASVFGCFRRESTWSSGRDVSTALEPLFDATIRRSRTPWTPCVKKRTDRATAQHIFGHAEKQRFLISSIPAAATSGKSVSPVRGPCAMVTGVGCVPCAICACRSCPAAERSCCCTRDRPSTGGVCLDGVILTRPSRYGIYTCRRAARIPISTPVESRQLPHRRHLRRSEPAAGAFLHIASVPDSHPTGGINRH